MCDSRLTACYCAGDVPEAKQARKYAVLESPVPAAADGSPVSDSSKEGTLDPEAGAMVVDLLKPDKKKTPVASKPRRLFGLTTLAALRQRPQLAALSRQKEAQLSTAKADQLRSSSPPARPSANDDTAGPSNAPFHSSPQHAGMAVESASAGPSSATAAASSDWNLAQSQGANQAQHEGHSMPVHSDSAQPAPASPASVIDGAHSTASSLPKTWPKLANRDTPVHHGDQSAVSDDSAGPQHPEPAGSMAPAAESAAAALHDGATASEQPSTAQETQRAQPMQAQQAGTSQQAAASTHVWGTLNPHRHAPPGQVADESFPPLSQARERRPRPLYHPPAGLAADTAGPSGHADTAELSFGDFTTGTSSMVASVRQPGGSLSQQGNDLGANAEPSRQAQTAELESAPQAEADAAQSRAESSLQASVSGAASAAPAEAAGPSLVFGQGITGRGAFQLSNELQMALSGKPKPGRRGQVAVPLPEPSADLVLQRALMEKPKPRPRPRRPPVTPQSTGTLSQTAFIWLSILPDNPNSRIESVVMGPIAFIIHLWPLQCNAFRKAAVHRLQICCNV